MTTYFITFANIFEAATFKQFIEAEHEVYKSNYEILYINSKHCSFRSPNPKFANAAYLSNLFSDKSTIKYKQVRKGVTRYIKIPKPSKQG